MHMQAPTITTSHRPPLLAGVIALVGVAAAAGAIALTSGDDSSQPAVAPAKPAVVQNADTRVLDGSPLLRTRSAAPKADTRVLDGSPLLRAGSPAPAVTVSSQAGIERVWDGSPILRGSTADPHSGGGPARLPAVTSSLAGTTSSQPKAQFPVRPPEGFHRAP
jgi:hypothetical protein